MDITLKIIVIDKFLFFSKKKTNLLQRKNKIHAFKTSFINVQYRIKRYN